jgi:hypothetical protein
MFEDFWKLYPRKVSKRTAEASWKRLNKLEQELALEAIQQHIQYWSLKETASEFIPHASTWLNQGRWEDELDMTVKEIKKPSLPWYSNDDLTLAKGKEIGVLPNAGESMGQYRTRIHSKLGKMAT